MPEQPELILCWESLNPRKYEPHYSGKTMICGHTAQKKGNPLVLPGAICIDTWAYGDGWLTCLDVDSGQYWQANELGETRIGSIPRVRED
jgi:serine/threonine protein phosphatase 1